MTNPFAGRAASLNGPATDILPVVPDDSTDLSTTAVALYVETGGTLTVNTIKGETRSFTVGDLAIVPIGVTQVHATGTSASGIHAFTV
ncbi:spike base protein, RCAP_Rcc01079 family [Celeribacter sp.]|uniref:spike base protein, RCAP_Rcc01079 family n=1 Tax=Celeribacter sp. TaxID=1890673 RepID=UPI003A9037E2